jgi:tetratricopeptide (TPR) repeat protein
MQNEDFRDKYKKMFVDDEQINSSEIQPKINQSDFIKINEFVLNNFGLKYLDTETKDSDLGSRNKIANDLIKETEKFIQNKEFSKAESNLKFLNETVNNNSVNYYNIAYYNLLKENTKESIDYLYKTINIKKDFDSLMLLISNYYKLNYFDKINEILDSINNEKLSAEQQQLIDKFKNDFLVKKTKKSNFDKNKSENKIRQTQISIKLEKINVIDNNKLIIVFSDNVEVLNIDGFKINDVYYNYIDINNCKIPSKIDMTNIEQLNFKLSYSQFKIEPDIVRIVLSSKNDFKIKYKIIKNNNIEVLCIK